MVSAGCERKGADPTLALWGCLHFLPSTFTPTDFTINRESSAVVLHRRAGAHS